jgi:hypothetical protein
MLELLLNLRPGSSLPVGQSMQRHCLTSNFAHLWSPSSHTDCYKVFFVTCFVSIACNVDIVGYDSNCKSFIFYNEPLKRFPHFGACEYYI